MKHAGDEAYLEQAAAVALGGEEVLAAGLCSWQDLLAAEVAGAAVGGVAGSALAGSGAAGGVGASLGAYAATREMASANGMTVALLMAVTASTISVFNWDGDQVGVLVSSFDRATTDVRISRMGLSRVIHLHDTAAGTEMAFHTSVSPISAQSKPDKVVLHLLAAPA